MCIYIGLYECINKSNKLYNLRELCLCIYDEVHIHTKKEKKKKI